MMANKITNEVMGITEAEVQSIYHIPEEAAGVIKLLKDAEAQTAGKEIKVATKVQPLRNLFNKLRIMFRYGFHWSKPFYLVRLARNIILSKLYILLGIPAYVLRGCEFDITFRCNFSCCHCSVARLSEPTTRKELEIKEYEQIVNAAMRLGAVSFGLEGGEPFVKENWDKIVKVCRPKYNHIIITTNGFLFDEEIAKRCADLGVDTINLSLDNGIPELHDLFRRKKGSFARIMHAVELCKKYKLKVIINTVVHKGNLYTAGFRKILAFAEKERILVHILFAKAIGNFKDSNLMLDEDDFRAYEKIIAPYSYVFVHHDTRMAYGRGGCNGTKEMLQFTPYGDVMNCANMHIYFGNIREEPLAEIRKRALKETPFARYRPCFLTLDRDFMNIYYPLLERKAYVSVKEFSRALRDYEEKHHKIVYPELHLGLGKSLTSEAEE